MTQSATRTSPESTLTDHIRAASFPVNAARRIVILSDLHLGRHNHPIADATMLRPIWRECDLLILNGDTAEIHHPAHRGAAARVTIELLKFCDRDNVNVVLLSGNHDPMISDHRHLVLASGEVFVTHGDVFHPSVAPWSPRAGVLRRAYDRAYEAVRGTTPTELEARFSASQHASRAEWDDLADNVRYSTLLRMLVRPWLVPRVLWYWRRFPHLAVRFAAEHDIAARYLVFGHTHRPSIRRIGERVVINTGSFTFPGRPCAVIMREHELHVTPLRRVGREYRFAKRPWDVFPLTCGLTARTDRFSD